MPDFMPPGRHSVTTRLVVDEPAKLVQFLRHAFGATGEYVEDRPADMLIGNSIIMINGTGPREATRSFLYLYVKDADATYQYALDAGAISVEEPQDTPYGDRRAMVVDPWDNAWQIATHRPAADG
jgi:PhnB protein